jgi:hypothetical protein
MCYASAVAASKQDPRVLLKYAIFLERCNFVEQAEDTYLLVRSSPMSSLRTHTPTSEHSTSHTHTSIAVLTRMCVCVCGYRR